MKKTFFDNIDLHTLILCIINFVLFIVLIIAYLPKPEAESVNTSLILKDDSDLIEEIVLTIPDNSLPPNFNEFRLTKKNKIFVYKTGGGEYPIDESLINRLFEVLTKKETVTFITDDINQYKNFGLDKNNAVKMQLIRSDKTVAGEFTFGKKDTLGKNLYLLPDGRTKIFKMPDNISPFLTMRSDFWINLQIYKSLFEQNKIQSIEKNGEHIIRSGKNDNYFSDLELFLKQFSCVDIFPAMPLTSINTEYFTIVLGSGEKMLIGETPLESGDYILFDSKLKNGYVISGYTKRKIDSALERIYRQGQEIK